MSISLLGLRNSFKFQITFFDKVTLVHSDSKTPVIPRGTGQISLPWRRQKEVHIYLLYLISRNLFSRSPCHPAQYLQDPPESREGDVSDACPPADTAPTCNNPTEKQSHKVSAQKSDIAQIPQMRALRFAPTLFCNIR